MAPNIFDPLRPFAFLISTRRTIIGSNEKSGFDHEVAFHNGELTRLIPNGIQLPENEIAKLILAVDYTLDPYRLNVRARTNEIVPCPHPDFDDAIPNIIGRLVSVVHPAREVPSNQVSLE